jgi:endonuclease G
LSKIGSSGVTVPQNFYKVIYDPGGQGKMIAFIIPNESSNNPLQSFVVSVDYIESITGIDFFPELPDSVENLLECIFLRFRTLSPAENGQSVLTKTDS